MKTVCKFDQCAGCMACVEACPVNAISVKDGIRAYNAVIDEIKCIHCNACEKSCAQIQPPEFRPPQQWYQGWAVPSIRGKSSSGGFAASLMAQFIRDGGVVCTCVFSKARFGFQFLERMEQIASAIGSKYVKSDPSGIYKEMRSRLRLGQKILMIGLPCQTAGALKFVGEKYTDQLYTVDLICHGSPSPYILDSYLKEQGYSLDTIDTIEFRRNTLYGLFVNHKKIKPERVRDRYIIGFLKGVFYTDNCYSCQYAKTERITDLTIGDSWGTKLPEMEQKQGISLVLCQTAKGRTLMERCELKLLEVDQQKAIAANHQLRMPSQKLPEREQFFAAFERGRSVGYSVTKCYKKHSLTQDAKEILVYLKILR